MSQTSRRDGSTGYTHVPRATNSFRMSFCGVVTTLFQATPCFSATTRNIAWMKAAIELMVNEIDTRSAVPAPEAPALSGGEQARLPTPPPPPPPPRASGLAAPRLVVPFAHLATRQ